MTQNLKQWNEFMVRNGGSFLQSWEWGEFQKKTHPIWRIGNGKWQALLISNALPMGLNYLYCPGGPMLGKEPIEGFLSESKKIARKSKALFLKVEPMVLEERGVIYESDSNAKDSVKSIQPQRTIILNLTKSEKGLLSSMHRKTRYNIGLAKKHIVHVYASKNNSDVEIFLSLLKKTSTRDNFSSHPPQYYRDLLRIGPSFVQLFLAERDGHVIAAHILIFFSDTVTYLHGASDYDSRSYMAPYLLQWESIVEAKKRGYKKYDFWGIDGKKWPGVTRFKKGFSKEEVTYAGSFDYVYKRMLYAGYILKQRYLPKM